tara:strand:- start:44 stop:331 length:288 start_codon:yes stop_codon:yes gene_type:complete
MTHEIQNGKCLGAELVAVKVAKMTHKTNAFNDNQKVWLQYMSGAQSARVTGKWRGKGRYVSSWIKWDSKNKKAPKFKEIKVPLWFMGSHKLDVVI